MKSLYIILFSIDLLLMGLLAFLFFKMMDEKAGSFTLFETLLGVVISICVLFVLVKQYSKVSISNKSK
ncbi:MAG: hypothetical protein JST23_08065 [Bacteroidetes bacterium]|nr:hypothetical protein [Bacteroidota bacterium]